MTYVCLFDKLYLVIVVKVTFNVDDDINTIDLDKNIMLFGKNTSYKNKFVNTLINCLSGKNKSILIDGKKYESSDYNVVIINEENDFANQFKFSKTNTFKELIYHDIITKINEEKMISYTNEIFDVIDEKVNRLLDRKINKSSDNNLSFQIEIPSVTSIIDKYTNIYIDNILLNDNEVSKSMKRKLLYELYFLELKNCKNKINIIVIDNFDVYLNQDEVIHVLNEIEKLSANNCYFILSTCNNIFEYMNINNFNIYKITDNLKNLDLIDEAIKCYLLKKEYNNLKCDFSTFYKENEYLISKEEISDIKSKVLNDFPHKIGKILNSTSINIVNKRPKKISSEYIVCNNSDYSLLFSEICNKFID